MSIEINPVGLQCNLRCQYCYEDGRHSYAKKLDLSKAFEQLKKANGPFHLHGGEPLLCNVTDLEKILAFGKENFKWSGIQTNGSLLTEKHIELFKKYNVNVGVSIDGPPSVNIRRCPEKVTMTIMNNIQRLIDAKVSTSVLTVLGSHTEAHFDGFLSWLSWLDSIGVRWYRTHLLDGGLIVMVKRLFEYQSKLKHLKNEMIVEMLNNLQGKIGKSSCAWRGCDPYFTSAVTRIEGDGHVSTCARIGDRLKAEKHKPIRNIALLNSDCKGCRFFTVCHGYCPATAPDWREKTVHCFTIFELYSYFERELRRLGIETVLSNPEIAMNCTHGDVPHGNSHGDHTDSGVSK